MKTYWVAYYALVSNLEDVVLGLRVSGASAITTIYSFMSSRSSVHVFSSILHSWMINSIFMIFGISKLCKAANEKLNDRVKRIVLLT